MVVGFTCGTFDLLHAGHVLMLQEASEVCDFLVVGLHIDPSQEREWKNKPIQTIHERFIQLEAIKYVDFVLPYHFEQDMHELLQILRVNVRIVGEEYRNKPLSGEHLHEELNIRLHYNNRGHGFSSTELRDRVKRANKKSQLN
jgi:glycerol-3-phosphate cytidylyltransferase|tara:strand:+ start:96 stop:524 length:429 start_codon:yes stop_codon:yes gene_type:complete